MSFIVTHKLKKTDLKKEGYDLEKVGKDEVYFLHEKKFQLLTPELIKKVTTGDIKIWKEKQCRLGLS